MTLVETTVLITLSAVLSGIIISGIASIFRFNDSMARHGDGQTAMQQFVTTLRADIHRAHFCRWNDDQQTLTLQLDEAGSLEYHVVKNRWVRVSATADVQPTVTSFGLNDSIIGNCQEEQATRGELLHLTFSNRPNDETSSDSLVSRPLECELVALVGRDIHQVSD